MRALQRFCSRSWTFETFSADDFNNGEAGGGGVEEAVPGVDGQTPGEPVRGRGASERGGVSRAQKHPDNL